MIRVGHSDRWLGNRINVNRWWTLVVLAGLLMSVSRQGDGAPPSSADPPKTTRQPFVRDVTTGYLLNYFFLSPKPYCWEGKESLLSGWEVDRRGGHVAFRPTGKYPEEFAFHSDWFKLVDTSSEAGITLTHQIARQTAGPITLEFRFRFPTRMGGACWQLRDLEQAGISLVTSDGNLCAENASGEPRQLLPIETDREYGVKVVADITARQWDIYVDGKLQAQAVPFLHPVETLDLFLVKTGDAAQGEMFLNPVNIYRGYVVNETFVTCGTGQLPADWTQDSGTALVQEFECGTKPDIFSVQLAGAASRRFAPVPSKTVFEFRFLLPVRDDAMRVELGGGGAAAISLGPPADYRTNFWYMVKVVADPVTQTAEVHINGKRVVQGVALQDNVPAYDMVRFAGNMWFDDVQVYPWRDYPADYVPEPQPCPARSPYLLGVQSCNLWREGKAYAGWDYVVPYRDKREPSLGWYDEGHPEAKDWEIKWQVEHGIGFEMHCWYRPNNAINHPIKDGVLDQGIIQGLFNARYSHLAKFAIMCTNQGACETNPQDWRENIIPYWIEYFFRDPRYLTIDGKPVLSIYQLSALQQMFGGNDGARQAIQTLREEVARAGFPGILVWMEDRTADPGTLQSMKDIGVDCCYSYTWFTRDADDQRKKMMAQRDASAAASLDVLPSISMGWDREAWGVHDGGWVPVAEYRTLARWTKDEFMPGLPADSLGRRIVMLANWNEFGEGHFLMPSALAGFGYLDALRDVFTAGDIHQDAVPTAAQKHRFTALYPKE